MADPAGKLECSGSVATRILQYRFEKLQKFAPNGIKCLPSMITDAAELIKKVSDQSSRADVDRKHTLLREDLAVAATRVWEAWSCDPNTGIALFPDWAGIERQDDVSDMIKERMRIVESSFSTGWVNRLREFTPNEQDVVDAAKQDFRNAQEVVDQIRTAGNKNEIASFLGATRFLTFSGIMSATIIGLSSVDGTRVYISEQTLLANPAKHVLVHEIAHNWKVWRQPIDEAHIASSQNTQLKAENGSQISAGDFIEERLYGKSIVAPNPFCLNRNIANDIVAMMRSGPVKQL